MAELLRADVRHMVGNQIKFCDVLWEVAQAHFEQTGGEGSGGLELSRPMPREGELKLVLREVVDSSVAGESQEEQDA